MLSFQTFIIDTCFLANKDYPGNNLKFGCTRKDSIMECQNLCQATQGCAKFSYVTDTYDGKHGTGARKNCCLKSYATMDLVDETGVISGPRSCRPSK